MCSSDLDPKDFSFGLSLFTESDRRYVVACKWETCATIDQDGWMIFGTMSYNSHYFEFRDRQYKEISRSDGPPPAPGNHMQALAKASDSFISISGSSVLVGVLPNSSDRRC